MRGDRRGWYKVSGLRPGVEIATPDEDGSVLWDEIVSITHVGREQVYDIEVEGMHNFVGNGIFAHNTYVLRANTMLAVEGEVHAEDFIVPVPDVVSASATSSSAIVAEIPSSVLTADGLGVDLYKLATYNLTVGQALAEKVGAHEMRLVSLEERVEKLESGAVSIADDLPLTLSTTSLANALNSLGVFVSKGFAQFGTLIADRFVAATDSAGASSAGAASVLAGNTAAQVMNAYVLPTTKVFITFSSPVTGNWHVSDKQDGSFRVVLSEVQTADVSFDYFLIQTEGQLQTNDSGNQTTDSGSQISDGSAGGGATTTGATDATATSTNSGQTTMLTDTTGATENDTTQAPPDVTPSAVSDVEPPVVTLTGAAAMQVTVGDAFTDPGATATDDTDGDLTTHINVSGVVDATTAGLYELTYSATDAAGNTGSASRVVTVVAPPPAPADTPPADASPADSTDSGVVVP